jgi:hypothetical protein
MSIKDIIENVTNKKIKNNTEYIEVPMVRYHLIL